MPVQQPGSARFPSPADLHAPCSFCARPRGRRLYLPEAQAPAHRIVAATPRHADLAVEGDTVEIGCRGRGAGRPSSGPMCSTGTGHVPGRGPRAVRRHVRRRARIPPARPIDVHRHRRTARPI